MPATKKKQAKKVKLTNVSGRKKALLITVLVFVAVGVGILIKSFAATATYAYTPSNGALTASTGSTVAVDSGKNGVRVLVVNGSGQAAVSSNPQLYVPKNQKFYACISESGGDMVEVGTIVPAGGATITFKDADTGKPLAFGLANNPDRYPGTYTRLVDGYIEICRPMNDPQNKTFNFAGPVQLFYAGATTMRVSAFTLKFVDSFSTPAATK